jgi:proline iminopeptidase
MCEFEGFVDANGVRIYCKIIGAGVPLMCLHGGPGGSHDYFLPYLLGLAKSFRLVFFDQRGCGRSERLADRSRYNIPAIVEDVEVLRQKLRLGRISLLGHSFGGLLALTYALRYGDALHALILVGAAASQTEMNKFYYKVWRKADSKAKEILRRHRTSIKKLLEASQPLPEEYVRIVQSLFRRYLYAPGHDYMEEFLQRVQAAYSWEVRLEMVGGGMMTFRIEGNTKDYDLRSQLQRIKVPVLIVAGAYEPPFYRTLITKLKHHKFTLFNNSGHFPFVEERDKFVDVVESFLKSL